MQLPAYDDLPDINSELPAYSRNVPADWDIPPLQTEHSYHLTKKNGKPWLSLNFISRAATVEDSPLLFQGALIGGSVKSVDLEREDPIDSISMNVTEQIAIATQSPCNFLNISRTLWTLSDAHTSSNLPVQALKKGKLKGRYEWPFSIRLPKGVSLLSFNVGLQKNFRLPLSLSDSACGVRVEYQMTVRVRRGLLHAASKRVMSRGSSLVHVRPTCLSPVQASCPYRVLFLSYDQAHAPSCVNLPIKKFSLWTV
ncbi:hypothetical protein AcV5_008720 [Taiwanofungus camphoratus]|nr:hypothetical protein AcV5_008720 [Antrodia cinnamomea]KAI0956275.1 hypothetical protein AcV7_006717 [Antrodia cinnamomea]